MVDMEPHGNTSAGDIRIRWAALGSTRGGKLTTAELALKSPLKAFSIYTTYAFMDLMNELSLFVLHKLQ